MGTPNIIAPDLERKTDLAPPRPARLSLKSWFSLIPWPVVAPIALFLLTVAAFLPAIMADYVYWDDDDLLINTVIYRTLDRDSLHWMFTTSYAGHFQPLTWLSYWLDWTLWKREVSGYHLTSVLLHAGTALLFYFLVRRLFFIALRTTTATDRNPGSINSPILCLASALAAALFAVHPLRVESVAWLAERRDVLSGFFFVASIASYVRWRAREAGQATTRGWYWLALLFQLLSLSAKASAVSLPFVLLILDVFPLRRLDSLPWKKRIVALLWDKAPFLMLAAVAGARAWVAQVEAGAMYPLIEHDPLSRVAQALYGLSFYAWKTVLPLNLGPLYQIPRREVLMGSLLWKGLLGSAILLALALASRKRRPAATAAIAAYVVMMVPVSGIFQSGPQLVADRYSYLSCLGFAVLPVAGLLRLVQSNVWRMRNAASVIVLACAVGLTAIFYATTEQAKVWTTALDLWSHAVKVSPDSSIVHTNLADAFMSLPNPRIAAIHYRRAMEIEPRDAIAAHHFGDALSAMGNDRAAEELYLRSLGLDPGRPGVYISLARLWIARGHAYQAANLLRDRVRRAPYDLAAAGFLAELLATHPDHEVRDGCEASELAARISLAHEHKDANALLTWASAQAEDGQWEEAVVTARRGQRLADKLRLENLSREFRRRLDLFEREVPYHYGD
jgi:Flp pilus assembly protein TadD